MTTLDVVVERLTALRDKARAKLGQNDLDLSEAVDALIAGYGSSDDECAHTNTEERYDEVGSGSHQRSIVCKDCGMVVSTEATESCSAVKLVWENYGNGSHARYKQCVCGRQTSYGSGDCTDADGDGLCDLCGFAM